MLNDSWQQIYLLEILNNYQQEAMMIILNWTDWIHI